MRLRCRPSKLEEPTYEASLHRLVLCAVRRQRLHHRERKAGQYCPEGPSPGSAPGSAGPRRACSGRTRSGPRTGSAGAQAPAGAQAEADAATRGARPSGNHHAARRDAGRNANDDADYLSYGDTFRITVKSSELKGF